MHPTAPRCSPYVSRHVFERLPELSGTTVLDPGCAIDDQAAELAARGARLIAVDSDLTLLEVPRARYIPNTDFRADDLRAPLDRLCRRRDLVELRRGL